MSENFHTIPVSEDIQRQMPDHLEPGSLLAQIRCPLSIIWTLAEALGASEESPLYKWFYQHLNSKHFGQK
jgi:hypothetical protein